MRQAMRGSKRTQFASAVMVGLLSTPAFAQLDSLQTVVSRTNAVGSGTSTIFAGYVYDQATDTAFIASSGSGQGLRSVTGVSTSPVSSLLVSDSQWQYWFRGNSTLRSGVPAVQGLAFNAARDAIFIADQGTLTNTAASDGNTQRNNPLNKTIYSWNRGAALPANDLAAGGTVLTQVMSRATYAGAAGLANPNTVTTNPTVSQPALAVDGSFYMLDASAAYGGLWKVGSTPGATPTKIVNTAFSGKTEVSAKPIDATTDRIYVPQSNTTTTPGIGYVEHNTTNGQTSSFTELLSGATINEFIGGPSTVEYSIGAIASDAAGNIYFDVTGGNVNEGTRRSVVLRLDFVSNEPRLVKVVSNAERRAFFGNATTVTSKLQFRTNSTFNGPNGNVVVPQLLFGDTASSGSYIGGAYLFAPGDFDRDGVVDSDDAGLFANALQPVGQTTDNLSKFKFDLNGALNVVTTGAALAAVDHADVKVFQDFYAFPDGDTDFDLQLDFDDLNTLSANYLQDVDKVWTLGDFTGDNRATFADLQLLADTWLDVLGQPRPTLEQLSVYAEPFRADAIIAFAVPEPAGAAILAASVGLLGLQRRRRTQG